MFLRDALHGTIVRRGTQTYRVYRLEQFAGGLLGTMKPFASLQPCELRADGWWDIHTKPREIRNWSDPCELVDDSHTAVAGDVYDTRKTLFPQ